LGTERNIYDPHHCLHRYVFILIFPNASGGFAAVFPLPHPNPAGLILLQASWRVSTFSHKPSHQHFFSSYFTLPPRCWPEAGVLDEPYSQLTPLISAE